ncbi:MAG: LysE family transporter [Nanoarchaeota archaeon]|jgi:threonine/homoserine/homoserine lactone efflux protein|nr:LysE family transporter [Nanoarchaeota archaeon]
MIDLLLKGFIIGLIVAAPIGVPAVLCIRRSLLRKDLSGLMTGFGAASTDFSYAIIAGFGISIISDSILTNEFYFQLFGGILLTFLGIRGWTLKKGFHIKKERKNLPYWKDFASGFVVTIINPITLLAFFIGYSFIETSEIIGNPHASIVLVLGSLIGSIVVWSGLNFAIKSHQKKLKKSFMSKINKISGTAIILFGMFLLLEAIALF